MKNLIIDSRMIKMSGIGRYISELLPYIINEIKEVVLLGNLKDLEGYDVEKIKFDVPIYSVKEQIGYYKIVPKSHLFWSPHFNVPLGPIKSKKRITTIHDAYHLAFYKNLSFFEKIYAKKVIYHALNKSDKIITVSNFSKNELLKYTNIKYQKKIEVIYNGISNEKEYEDNYNLYTPFFLFVGNVKPHKNLKNAIVAYKMLLEDLPACTTKPKFKIVGKKEGFINGSNAELEKILFQNPVLNEFVEFTGFVSDKDLNMLYLKAVALIFPSIYEGFGIPPLEAMKHYCPVIASEIPAVKEICKDNILYFDPFNLNDIKNKMKQMYLDNMKIYFINKGNKLVKIYNWEKAAKCHVEIFKQLL